jgi:hypothetical protein
VFAGAVGPAPPPPPPPPNPGVPGLPVQVRLSFIELIECDPPAGVEPIAWRLLTTHPIADAAQDWQIVDWYRARRTIEHLFRLLKKQGLYPGRQPVGNRRAAAQARRHRRACRCDHLAAEEPPPASQHGVGGLADRSLSLGGWDGYRSSRPPGPITFKIGLDRLFLLAQGWSLGDVCMPWRLCGGDDLTFG